MYGGGVLALLPILILAGCSSDSGGNSGGEDSYINSVSITPTSATITVGGAATTLTANASVTGSPTIQYEWTVNASGSNYVSLSNKTSATVTVNPVASGTATVTLTAKDNNGNEKTANATITVKPAASSSSPAITGLTVTPESDSISTVGSTKITAAATTTGTVSLSYKWEITEGGDYATLSATSGTSVTLTGKNTTNAEKTVKLKVTASDSTSGSKVASKSEATSVKVAAKTLTGIEITTDATKTEFTVGETFTSEGIRLKATYSDGSEAKNLDPTSVSTPNMTSEGTPEVTVTYKDSFGEETTTYTITVSASSKISSSFTLSFVTGDSDLKVAPTSTTNDSFKATPPDSNANYTYKWYIDLTEQNPATDTLTVSSLSAGTHAILVTATNTSTGIVYTAQYELKVE